MVDPLEVLHQAAHGYERCLLFAPMPTRALTQAGIWGLGDVISQLYETRTVKQKRFWSFFFTGLGSGVVWACYYPFADRLVAPLPGGKVTHAAIETAMEQFVFCPIVYSGLNIPAAVLQNGGEFKDIPAAIQTRLVKLLVANFKLWTPANMLVYSAPLQWQQLIANAFELVWGVYCSTFAASTTRDTVLNESAAGHGLHMPHLPPGLNRTTMSRTMLNRTLWIQNGSQRLKLRMGQAIPTIPIRVHLPLRASLGLERRTLQNRSDAMDAAFRAQLSADNEALMRRDCELAQHLAGRAVGVAAAPPAAPPVAASPRPECEDARRRQRRLSGARELASMSGETRVGAWRGAWQAEWEDTFECWYLALPLPAQQQLGQCLGALSLHLGSRLRAGVRAALGDTLPSAHWANLDMAESERASAQANGACTSTLRRLEGEWGFPGFPALPSPHEGNEGASSLGLPALPRLLPTWERLQWLQSLGAANFGTAELPDGSKPSIIGTSSLRQWRQSAAPGRNSPPVVGHGLLGLIGGGCVGATAACAALWMLRTPSGRAVGVTMVAPRNMRGK